MDLLPGQRFWAPGPRLRGHSAPRRSHLLTWGPTPLRRGPAGWSDGGFSPTIYAAVRLHMDKRTVATPEAPAGRPLSPLAFCRR